MLTLDAHMPDFNIIILDELHSSSVQPCGDLRSFCLITYARCLYVNMMQSKGPFESITTYFFIKLTLIYSIRTRYLTFSCKFNTILLSNTQHIQNHKTHYETLFTFM